jgi:hypothetical protein
MSNKKNPIKKVVVKLDMSHLTLVQKIAFARDTQNTAKATSQYQGSPAAQTAMGTWITAAATMEQTGNDIAKYESLLATAHAQQQVDEYNFDQAGVSYASIVHTLAKGDPKVVTAMGLSVRNAPTLVSSLVAPTGLLLATSHKGVQSFHWDKVPGARIYVMQLSVDPATDATWATLAGKGRSRKLVALISGQKYLARVKALGSVPESPWSMLGFTAK